MRVASRRLRSVLRDFMPYLSKRHLNSSLHEIKNVADALGRVRDQDVALLALEKLAQKAPPLVVASINRFAELRGQKREEARAALLRTLDRDPAKLDIVGLFPDYASAERAWRAKAQQTVDSAQTRYYVVHPNPRCPERIAGSGEFEQGVNQVRHLVGSIAQLLVE